MDIAFQPWNDAPWSRSPGCAFIRIAELRSISASARALGVPESSVSRSLVRLEDRLGIVLIERSTRNLRLTDAGRLFQMHALRILADVDEAEAAIGNLSDVPHGALRINAPAPSCRMRWRRCCRVSRCAIPR